MTAARVSGHWCVTSLWP